MGIWESALILLGIGIVSERFGAGTGLGSLGVGIRELAAAPLGGVGAGLGEFSFGLRSFGEAIGDIGRGFGTFFENVPKFGREGFPPRQPPAVTIPSTPPPLITVSGGDKTSLSAGGGGNVPQAQLQELLALRAQYPRSSPEAQFWNTVINQVNQSTGPGGIVV